MSDLARDADTAASPDKPGETVQGFRAAEEGSGKASRIRLEQEIRELKERIAALQAESAVLLDQGLDGARLADFGRNRILILAAEARLKKCREQLHGGN
jgi:hypothetical protein